MAVKQYTLKQIADHVGGYVDGDPCRRVSGLMPIDKAQATHLTFHANASYNKALAQSEAAVLLNEASLPQCQTDAVVCDSPYLAYAQVAELFAPKITMETGVHATACIDSSAKVHESACIGAHVVIGPDVSIGKDCVIQAGTVIGERCQIGDHCRLMANVTLYRDCILDVGVVVHSGAVIGSEGFGHAEDENKHWVLIPQLGRVIIHKKAEIGANTTIDRGALDDTIIGEGVIIDNLVQIAHNVVIGDHTAIAACVGISGSVVIGKHCKIAGQVGIAGHLTIADHVILLARCAVTKSIREPGIYSGSIACQERTLWNKNAARFRQLHRLLSRLKKEECA